MKNRNDIDELLAKHFADEPLDKEQQQELEEWKIAHQEEFDHLSQLMHLISKQAEQVHFDSSQAWNKIENRLSGHDTARLSSRRIWQIGSIAASLLLIIGLSIYWFSPSSSQPVPEYANAGNTEKLIVLPDSSEVTLSPASRLAYHTGPDGCRRVELEGKAFFSVRKNGTRFLVNTPSLDVEVLGTSFLVQAVQGKDMTGVYVATGKVKVSASDSDFTLHACEKLEIADGEIRTGKIENPQNVFESYHHELQFEETPLAEVIRQICQQTGVRIDLDDNLKNNKITTRIDLLDIESILTEISLLCHCRCDTLITGKHYRLHEE